MEELTQSRDQCGKFWATGVDIEEQWEKYLLTVI